MTYGICKLTAIAMRKEARHASEMVSQLLYNETYTVLDKTKDWVLVRTRLGSGDYPYDGWIQAKQLCEISEDELNVLKEKKVFLTNKPIVEYKGKFLSMGTPLFEPHPDAVEMPSEFHPELMVDYAKMLLGAPYLWGGRMAMGLDCSVITCLRSSKPALA